MPDTSEFRDRSGWVVLVAAIFAVALLAGCRKEEAKGPPPKPPVPVKVATAARQTVPVELRAVGNVEAVSTVEIKAQVGGALAQVHFREGEEVRRGDLLFTLDPRPFEAALRQAEAILARDQAQLEHARQTERRYADLLAGKFISRQEYDLVQTDAAALEATVRADRAAAENARLRLSWCTIRSPLDGRTGSLLAHAGDLIKADADQPMVVIHQLRPIDVTFAVPEQQLSRIRQQLAAGAVVVQAQLPGEEAPAEEGKLTFVDNAVDTATGTIRLKGSFANAAGRLWPGQFVTAALVLETLRDVVTVSSAAVQTGQQGTFVFVVKSDQSVEQRPVTAGVAWQGMTVVEGVQAGETVVVDGQMRLTPGAKVEVKSDKAGAGSQPAPASAGKNG